jgi:hypothetical protein
MAGAAITTQDYTNVLVGFMALAGTFMVGKIAIDSIMQSRKEHFEKKDQPKEAVKAKETTFDGIVKLAGIGITIYQITSGGPELLDQIDKMMKGTASP